RAVPLLIENWLTRSRKRSQVSKRTFHRDISHSRRFLLWRRNGYRRTQASHQSLTHSRAFNIMSTGSRPAIRSRAEYRYTRPSRASDLMLDPGSANPAREGVPTLAHRRRGHAPVHGRREK